MLINLSYGVGRDKNSDGDGLRHIGELISDRYKQALIVTTVVPNDLHPPVGVATRPFIFIGHSAGAGAAIKAARILGVEIELMILTDTFLFFADGQIIADKYVQPAWVKRLLAFRQEVGPLKGIDCVSGHNFREVILPALPGQVGLDAHTGVAKRPDVIREIMAAIDSVAGWTS